MDSKTVMKLVIGALIVVIILRMMNCNKAEKFVSASAYDDNEESDENENFADYDPMEMSQDEEGFVPKTTSRPVSSSVPLSTSVDLLPKAVAGSTDFGEFAPKNLGSQNFVDASKFIGVDTQGSSLRNANYSIRNDVPIPRVDAGPWSQSTIEADLNRRNVFC